MRYRQLRRLGHDMSVEIQAALELFHQEVSHLTDPQQLLLEWNQHFDEAETRFHHQGG
jgi:hypothetical protein